MKNGLLPTTFALRHSCTKLKLPPVYPAEQRTQDSREYGVYRNRRQHHGDCVILFVLEVVVIGGHADKRKSTT